MRPTYAKTPHVGQRIQAPPQNKSFSYTNRMGYTPQPSAAACMHQVKAVFRVGTMGMGRGVSSVITHKAPDGKG